MAKNTTLNPGEHTVDRNEPKWVEARKAYRHRFSVKLKDGRLLKDLYGQGPTKTAARKAALKRANELLKTGGNRGSWKPSSSLRDYVEEVTLPLVAKTPNENTRSRYMLAVGQLLGCRYAAEGHAADCDEAGLHRHDCEGHPGEKHAQSFAGHSIASGMRFRTIEANLQEIAALHGQESARQARTVLGKYLAQQLIRDEVIEANPIAGMSIDIETMRRKRDDEQGERVALTRDQWLACLDYLLAIDPEDTPKPRRGRWSHADAIAKRRNSVDLALFQVATGARQVEAVHPLTGLPWGRLESRDDGKVIAELWGKGSTVAKPLKRWVPLFDPRAAERILARRQEAPASQLVIGSPSDPSEPWDRDNANKASRAIYDELAEALGIPVLATKWGRSHAWRYTLNTLLRAQGVPADIRSAYFGHDEEINLKHYTDLRNVDPLLAAADRLIQGV